MTNKTDREIKLEAILRHAGRDLDRHVRVPSFWRIWLKARFIALFGAQDMQSVFMPVGATAVVMAAFLVGQLIPNVDSPAQGNLRFVNTIDMTIFEDVWNSPTDNLLSVDTLNTANDRRKNVNQMDAKGHGQTQ
ncbi:MAG: hypothetical protein V3T39_07455 [Gammaproteobacteria bacterium]